MLIQKMHKILASKFDSAAMQKEIDHLKKYMLIMIFEEGNILKETRVAWLLELQKKFYKLWHLQIPKFLYYNKSKTLSHIKTIQERDGI